MTVIMPKSQFVLISLIICSFYLLAGISLSHGADETYNRLIENELRTFIANRTQQQGQRAGQVADQKRYIKQMLDTLDESGRKSLAHEINQWEISLGNENRSMQEANNLIQRRDRAGAERALIASAQYLAEQRQIYELLNAKHEVLLQDKSYRDNASVFENKDATQPLIAMAEAMKRKLKFLDDAAKTIAASSNNVIKIAELSERAELAQIEIQAAVLWQAEVIKITADANAAEVEKIAAEAEKLKADNPPVPTGTVPDNDAIGLLEVRPDGQYRLNGEAVKANELAARIRVLVQNRPDAILDVMLNIDPKSEEANALVNPIGKAAKLAGAKSLRVYGVTVNEQNLP